MTVTPTGGSEVAPWDPNEYGNVGMEDVGAGDLVLPRLSIDHPKGLFVNNLSKETLSGLRCIIFGLVKQRIMWDSDVQEGDKPQCKSPDHDHGFPQMREDLPFEKQFPWDRSNFNKADYPPENGINNLITLPCESCVFNKWTKDVRTGKNEPPPCSEQHTYPLMYTTDNETWTTAVITFQRTGIKPSKSYLSLFSQANLPMFTSFTELSLQVLKRGTVDYSVPVFKRLEATPREQWRTYAESYLSIREFLRTPPRRQGDGDDIPVASDNTNSAPAGAPVEAPVTTAVPAAPTPAPAAAVPTPAPAAPAPTPAPTPAPAAPPANPDPSGLPF